MKNILRNITILSLSLTIFASGSLMAQQVGAAAPDFSLQTLKGKTFTLSAQEDKVVFIFLFGNNCSHCLANAPNTQNIYETYMSNPDFTAIGVDVWNGSASAVSSFKTRTGLNYQIAIEGAELTSKYGSTYDRILIVDKEGVLRYKSTANATSGESAKAAEMLETLLMEGSTGIDQSDIAEKALNVYPNPVRDFATVQTNFQPGSRIVGTLVDMSGKVVLNEHFEADQSGQFSISLNDYPSGVYYLRIRSEEKSAGIRLVI